MRAQISDEVSGRVLEDCQKIVKNNPSNLNPRGEIKWISSGDLPFSSIRMDGVFTPEHLLQIGKVLADGRSELIVHKIKEVWKADFVIDNMPKGAKPTYDCSADATPIVFKPGKDYDGCSIAGTVVKAKKDKGTKTRYTVPLHSITEKILEQVSFVVAQMRNNGYWMKGVVMCIRGDEIGLACHDPRLRQKKKMTPEEKALLKRVRGASSSHVN